MCAERYACAAIAVDHTLFHSVLPFQEATNKLCPLVLGVGEALLRDEKASPVKTATG